MAKNKAHLCRSVLLLLLLQVTPSVSQSSSNQGSDRSESRTIIKDQPEVHCSRERSRAASKIVDEYLMPFVELEKYQLSHKCRLHPSNNIFRDQEEHKIHIDISEWRCGYCKKLFRAENFLDQHFDNRHSNLLNSSQDKCLADLCGALHCDFVINSSSRKTKCNPAAAARNHHLCEDLANACFPSRNGPSAARLHGIILYSPRKVGLIWYICSRTVSGDDLPEFFLRQFCDAHTCSKGRKPFSRGGRKHTGVFYLAMSILIMMLLPIFYLLVYLYQREMRKETQQLKFVSKPQKKTKPS